MSKKFKLFSKLRTNVIEHPKITHDRLKKRKWVRIKNTVPQRLSEYGTLLNAKQILRAFYGNCSEKEFTKAYKKAKVAKGNTGVNFIKLLEQRLDTVLFRMRFANTFEEVRQFITHKHILVNGKVINSPTYPISSGDCISVRETSFNFIYGRVLDSFEQYLNIKDQENKTSVSKLNEVTKKNQLLLSPDYIDVNYNTLEGIFIKSPSLENIIYPCSIDLPNIIQYYEYKRKV
jgi:small subunit ribosomal protein S4